METTYVVFWEQYNANKRRPHHSPHNYFELFHHHLESFFIGPALRLICKITLTHPLTKWLWGLQTMR